MNLEEKSIGTLEILHRSDSITGDIIYYPYITKMRGYKYRRIEARYEVVKLHLLALKTFPNLHVYPASNWGVGRLSDRVHELNAWCYLSPTYNTQKRTSDKLLSIGKRIPL